MLSAAAIVERLDALHCFVLATGGVDMGRAGLACVATALHCWCGSCFAPGSHSCPHAPMSIGLLVGTQVSGGGRVLLSTPCVCQLMDITGSLTSYLLRSIQWRSGTLLLNCPGCSPHACTCRRSVMVSLGSAAFPGVVSLWHVGSRIALACFAS